MFRKTFLFGDGETSGGVRVGPGDLYTPEKGYGFVTEKNRREQELLCIPELNGAFETPYRDRDLTVIAQDGRGCFVESAQILGALRAKEGADAESGQRFLPLSFKTDVPRQGNYRVTVTIEEPSAPDAPSEGTSAGRIFTGTGPLLLFAGPRRLAYRQDGPAAGGFLRKQVTVNVCDVVPRGKERIYEDTSLDLTVVSDRPCLVRVEIEETNCPTVYIAGDSTVTDQSADYPYAPAASYAGWGQMLTAYLDSRAGVSNHAHSGLTTESFRGEGHYAVTQQYGRPGDFFLFQFGHNDQKLACLKAGKGYRDNLARYIGECQDKGIYPLLVTPAARNSWRGDDGRYNDLLQEYADVCLELGAAMRVPVLDLHGRTVEFVKALGLEGAKRYFYPGDFTHYNDYGAYAAAGLLSREIVRVCAEYPEPGYAQLAGFVTEGFGDWTPPEHMALPVKYSAYADREAQEEENKLFENLREPDKNLTRAEALEMVIRAARFFPVNVYNDWFTDVIGHERYAGTVECACQNGILTPDMCGDKRFWPERPVTLEEFLVFAVGGCRSRRRLPEAGACPYDEVVSPRAASYIREACALGALDGDGGADMGAAVSKRRAAQILRVLRI